MFIWRLDRNDIMESLWENEADRLPELRQAFINEFKTMGGWKTALDQAIHPLVSHEDGDTGWAIFDRLLAIAYRAGAKDLTEAFVEYVKELEAGVDMWRSEH